MEELKELLEDRPDDALGGEVEQIHLSDTALVLDDWSLRKGEEVFDSSDLLQHELDKLEDATDDRLRMLTADFFSAAFEPAPEVATHCKQERLSRYMQALMQTPEFAALKSETTFDEGAAEIAASHFARQWVSLVVQEEPEGELQQQVQALGAVQQALQDATQEVQDYSGAQDMLGIGSGAGDGSPMSVDEIRKRFQQIRSNPQLSRICQMAGRYRRLAQSCQRRRSVHGRDDLVGVELGGELARMLPSELVGLMDPLLEYSVMQRIVERSALCWEYGGTEPVARGPIVVCVDESSSMDGDPIVEAKSVALALYWIARHQKRWFRCCSFAGGPDSRMLTIAPGENKSDELIAWLGAFQGGGTTLDVILDTVPRTWGEVPQGKTDLVVITDAQVHLDEVSAATYREWKKSKEAKLQAIVIGRDAGAMPLISDRCWTVDQLGIDQSPIQEVFSI